MTAATSNYTMTGNDFREERIKRGLTVQEIADFVKLSHRAVQKWEERKDEPLSDLITTKIKGAFEADSNGLMNPGVNVIATDESMADIINRGDKVFIENAPEDFISYGKIHLIEFKDGSRLIRTLRKSSDPEKVILTSKSRDFDSIEVNLDSVLKFSEVVKVIKDLKQH